LTAATNPPVGRHLLLSKLEETLVVDGRRYELGVNRYPGAIYPQGYLLMKEFRLDPFPVFVYQAGVVEIEKRVFMVHGENTTVVEYELRSGDPSVECDLEIRPLLAFRDYHATTHRNDQLDPAYTDEPGVLKFAPYEDGPALHLAYDASDGSDPVIDPTGHWYFNFEYDIERERGLDFHEDLFNPMVMRFAMGAAGHVSLVASTSRRSASGTATLRKREVERRTPLRFRAPEAGSFITALSAATEQFLVARKELRTIIAGYHWFCDWGRDTMIALPGLTLVTGRYDIAREILLAFSLHTDRGMLPNRFPDAGEEPEYNTVDAALWFFEAVRAYLEYTGDAAFVHTQLYPVLKDIVDWHVRGTRYGIRVDGDGLLACGEAGVQLTWMDAKVGDWVVTPRYGKPVEIQALWYNALRSLADLARRFDEADAAARYEEMAARAAASFQAQFWNDSARCLYDVVDGDMRDGSIRPNQVLAISLRHSMVDNIRAAQALEVVQRELLTPAGLRSLSPFDPRYRGVYEGGPWQRDGAYHQGTVWPWLMGPFLTAWLRVHDRSAEALRFASSWLADFDHHLTDAGLGQVSEIFDGDAPHRPRGCIAQAWSVAELLRAAVEDVQGVRPVAAGVAGSLTYSAAE
jgi:predicted glycogen debranching enzyme